MARPTLSLVIANYNHGRAFELLHQSLLRSTVQPDEVVVVDDRSTDDSLERLRAIAATAHGFRLIENPTNRGSAASVLRGLHEATGEYVFAPAADDLIHPHLFDRALSLIADHPGLGLVHFDIATTDGRVNALRVADRPAVFRGPMLNEMLEKRGSFPASFLNSVIRRDLIPFDLPLEGLRWYWDVFAAMVIAHRGGMGYIPEALAITHDSPNSYSAKGRRSWRQQRQIARELLSLLQRPGLGGVNDAIRTTGVWPMAHPSLLVELVRRKEGGAIDTRMVRGSFAELARNAAGPLVPRKGREFYYGMRDRRRIRAMEAPR